MTHDEAWKYLQDWLPYGAGYEPCEWDEMQDTIDKYEEAKQVIDDLIGEQE